MNVEGVTYHGTSNSGITFLKHERITMTTPQIGNFEQEIKELQ